MCKFNKKFRIISRKFKTYIHVQHFVFVHMDEFHVDSIHQALLVVVKTYIINIVLALSLNGKNIIV